MKIVKIIVNGISRYFTHIGRARAREVLLRNSDRMLEDAGLSRELLESGVKAWPWRASTLELPPLALEQAQQPSVEHESTLNGDCELHDSGITVESLSDTRENAEKVIDRSTERKVA